MSLDGWERDELNTLHKRVAEIERLVAEIDLRTIGDIRLGPKENEITGAENNFNRAAAAREFRGPYA
ncbi:MAG: hypothetical protein NUV51_10995 [Sulfuricaulis sp.]|nr:hypothetical protein [Sulfuricaulis sp.]